MYYSVIYTLLAIYVDVETAVSTHVKITVSVPENRQNYSTAEMVSSVCRM